MDFKNILTTSSTIVIIGASSEQYRTSFGIAQQLQRKGYQIIPVNPKYKEVLGEKCYADMASLPINIQVDIVVIFRNKIYTEQMVQSVVNWSKQSGQKPLIWTQLDVSSTEAEKLAADNTLPYVKNRCIAVEYAKHIH